MKQLYIIVILIGGPIFMGSFHLPTMFKGKITGQVIYPGEYIPSDVTLYVETTKGEVVIEKGLVPRRKRNTLISNLSFSVKLNPGKYYLYVMSNYDPVKGEKAYYTEFMKCGMDKGCKSHEPVLLEIGRGEVIEDIKLGDWYVPGPASGH